MFSSSLHEDVLERDDAASGARPIGVLEKLRWGGSITEPVCVVVAHPDDETLFMGGRLAHLRDLALIQVTDGSPGTSKAAETRSKDCERR